MTVEANSAPSSKSFAIYFIPIIGVLGFLWVAWSLWNRPPALDDSVLGLKGFAFAAHKDRIEDGLDIQFNSNQGKAPDPEKTGLRILPLYDPNIKRAKQDTTLDPNDTLRNISSNAFQLKLAAIPTLVILPKWRAEPVSTEQFHEKHLIKKSKLQFPIEDKKNVSNVPEIYRKSANFSNFTPQIAPYDKTNSFHYNAQIDFNTIDLDLQLSLYAAQTISIDRHFKNSCVAMLQQGDDVLLAYCQWSKTGPKYWVLSDPDLLNNHGAANGDNFKFGLSLIRALSQGRPVLIDGTRFDSYRKEINQKEPTRSLSDLFRFINYPFSLFWIALLISFFFMLWHAWKRNGPVLDDEKESFFTASKATAIERDVGMLRGRSTSLTRDRLIARQYIEQRLKALEKDLFGRHYRASEYDYTKLITLVERRNPKLAERLRQEIDQKNSMPSPKNLFSKLNTLQKIIKEIRHEFGRSTNPRP